MHVKIASQVLDDIKSRSLDHLQDIEEEVITHGKVTADNKEELQKYFDKEVQPFVYTRSIRENPAFTDKLRLLTIMILCHKDLD